MEDELVQVKDHLDAAAAALENAAAAPDVGVTENITHVEAVDLEPAAEAAKHISDNEVEAARIAAAAEVEQARIAADVSLAIAEGAGVEERLQDIFDRLGRLEERAHDHNDEEEAETAGEIDLSALRPGEDAVEAIEEDAADIPAAPETPAEPAAPAAPKGAPKLYFGKKRA